MEATTAARARLAGKSFKPAFLTQEPNAGEESWGREEENVAALALAGPATDASSASQSKIRDAQKYTCMDNVPQHAALQVVKKESPLLPTDGLSKCNEQMRIKLEMMKTGSSFAFRVSVKEREAQNVQRLLQQTKTGFLKKMDVCKQHRENYETKKARFKELVVARSRLLQRNVEKAEECRRLLIENIRDTEKAQEDAQVLSKKAREKLHKCESIERLASHLEPFKAFVEAAANLCNMESAEGFMKRVTTLQSTNEELRKRLKESSERLEEKQAQCNALHAQSCTRRLSLASKDSCLRNQVEILRQKQQELEQAIDAKAQLVAKDAAAVGAVCTHVQMLHARLHQSRLSRPAAAAAAIAAAERTFFQRVDSIQMRTSKCQNSKLCLDVMHALRLLQQTGDLACKYKSMIKAAEQQLPLAGRVTHRRKSAPASLGRTRLLLPKRSGRGAKSGGKKRAGTQRKATCSPLAAAAAAHRLRPLGLQVYTADSSSDSPSAGGLLSSGTFAGTLAQEHPERPPGSSSPRSCPAKRNAATNHVILLYEERGDRVAAAPGEEDEDVVQFLLVEGKHKCGPLHRSTLSRSAPSSLTAALLRRSTSSSRLFNEKETPLIFSNRSSPAPPPGTPQSQTLTKSCIASAFLQEARVALSGLQHATRSAVLRSNTSSCREEVIQRLVSSVATPSPVTADARRAPVAPATVTNVIEIRARGAAAVARND